MWKRTSTTPKASKKYSVYLNKKQSFTLVLMPYFRQLGDMMNFAKVLPEKV